MNPFLSSNQQVNLSNGTANIFINQIEVGGSAQVPTMPVLDSSNAVASTEFVQNVISDVAGGNMLFVGTDPTIGKHYKQDSLDGKSATDSRLLETGDNFDFGAANLINVDNIECTQVSIGTTEYKNQSITDSIELNLNAPFIKSNTPSVIFSETTQISTIPDKNLTIVGGSLLNLYGNFINLNSTDHVDITTANINISSDTILTNSNITGNSFTKIGGTNIQYLMANGTTLTASANSGNSNFYLYNSGTSESPTPPSGYITYNNATQSAATMIYISHITRDNFDIEVYFKQITTLTEVYVQDENDSTLFIQYNVTSTPTISVGTQIAIPVLVNGTPGTTGFVNGRNVFISFFTNGLEVDTRLSALETKTQYQSTPSGNTAFSSNINLSGNQLINFDSISQTSGRTLNIGIVNGVSYNASINAVVGSNNTITDNEQWIYGAFNTINSNISVAVGSYNNVNSFNGNAIGRTNVLSAPQCNAMGYNNACSGAYSVAIGNDITNSTPHSVCLGDSAIATIYPNSLVCDLGTSARPYKDIYFSGTLINPGGGGGSYTFANAGTGTTLVASTSGLTDFKTCSISSGSNVSLSSVGNDIIISASGASGTNTINWTATSTNVNYRLGGQSLTGAQAIANFNTSFYFNPSISNPYGAAALFAPNISLTGQITAPTGFIGNASSATLINTTVTASNVNYDLLGVNGVSPPLAAQRNASFYYNPSTSNPYGASCLFVPNISLAGNITAPGGFVGNASSSTTHLINATSTNANYNILGTTAISGQTTPSINASFYFNPSVTGGQRLFVPNITAATNITAVSFTGLASQATAINTTLVATNTNYNLAGIAATSGFNGANVNASFYYNPSTSNPYGASALFVPNISCAGTITATSFSGSVSSATNLAGGTAASLPYQSAAGTTAFLANGSVNQVLIARGGTLSPAWANTSALVRGYVVPFSSGGTAAGYQYANSGMFGLEILT